MEDVQLNLGILSSLASTHLPSSFTFLFFKSIYIRSDIDSTAREIFGIANTVHLRGKVEELMDLLQSMYEHLFEMDYLLPQSNVCPNARDLNPQLKIDGFPNEESLWNSLCSNTVKGTYGEPGEMFGKPLNLSHIWNSTCERCTLQLCIKFFWVWWRTNLFCRTLFCSCKYESTGLWRWLLAIFLVVMFNMIFIAKFDSNGLLYIMIYKIKVL